MASQTLVPGETPRCALRSCHHVLPRSKGRGGYRSVTTGHAPRFGADHWQPRPPDTSAWLLLPQQGTCWEGMLLRCFIGMK